MGTQDIIFIGLNPATANFPSWHDEQYYGNLKRSKFQNAHLTDLFKTRATNKKVKDEISSWDRKEASDILKSEIDVIKPRIIVLLGKRVAEIYNQMFPGGIVGKNKIETLLTRHYSFRYGTRKKLRGIIRKEMKKVEKRYKSIAK